MCFFFKYLFLLSYGLGNQALWHFDDLAICSSGMTSFARNLLSLLWDSALLGGQWMNLSSFVYPLSSLPPTAQYWNSISSIGPPCMLILFASDKDKSFKYTSIQATCVRYIGLNINHEERASSILWVKSWAWYAIVVSLWSKETHNWISSNDFLFGFFSFSCPW